jgi:hypothetical protein
VLSARGPCPPAGPDRAEPRARARGGGRPLTWAARARPAGDQPMLAASSGVAIPRRRRQHSRWAGRDGRDRRHARRERAAARLPRGLPQTSSVARHSLPSRGWTA